MLDISHQTDAFEKISTEVLLELHNQAWQSFYQRREHEYKICIAFWTLYALVISQIVAHPTPFSLTIKLLFLASVILLMLLHIRWISGLASANLLDRKLAFYYGERLRELGNIKLPSNITIDRRYKKSNEIFSFSKTVLNWNHGAEIGVTAILTFIVAALLLCK